MVTLYFWQKYIIQLCQLLDQNVATIDLVLVCSFEYNIRIVAALIIKFLILLNAQNIIRDLIIVNCFSLAECCFKELGTTAHHWWLWMCPFQSHHHRCSSDTRNWLKQQMYRYCCGRPIMKSQQSDILRILIFKRYFWIVCRGTISLKGNGSKLKPKE